jgi:5-methylcytosine-specific restriction endonuclease McrA
MAELPQAVPAAGAPVDIRPAQRAHLRMVAASRARLEAANAKVLRNQARALDRALQRAATRFLPPGTQLDSPRKLDLVRWPFVGDSKLIADIPQVLRDSIMEADAICVWCRVAPSTTIDHVHPLSRGGSNHPLNLVGACEPCNSTKREYLPSELGWVLRLPQRAFALGIERLEAPAKTPEK